MNESVLARVEATELLLKAGLVRHFKGFSDLKFSSTKRTLYMGKQSENCCSVRLRFDFDISFASAFSFVVSENGICCKSKQVD